MTTVLPLEGIPEIEAGADLAGCSRTRPIEAGGLENGDVLVVAQKAVSKAEGRVVALADIEPSASARGYAGDHDPRHLEVILREAARVVRMRPPLVIAETRHGFVCASAGVDSSNAPVAGTVVLLPVDPDASARALRANGTAWPSSSATRSGARGVTGRPTSRSGSPASAAPRPARHPRPAGYELRTTTIAVADEIAGAAELVMGKAAGIPAAIVRGLQLEGDGSARELVMPPDRDLFR